VRSGGMKSALHFAQNFGDVIDMHNRPVSVEDFDEPAHVRALEFLGQIDIHADGGHGVLHFARFVPQQDGEAQTSHADFVDSQLAVIALALLVMQLGPPRVWGIGGFGW
jgi:hypothetical protein